MIKQSVSYFCDICGKQVEEGELLKVNYPVVFISEQIGRHTIEPYISQKEIEICPDCACSVLMLEAKVNCCGDAEYSIKEEGGERSDIYKVFKNKKYANRPY